MKIKHSVFVLVSLLFLAGCTDSRWEIDTSKIEYDGTMHRLDKALFSKKPITSAGLEALKSEYGDFLNMYLVNIMQVGPVDNPMTAGLLNDFLTDPTWVGLEKIIQKKHPNLASESKQLEKAFKRYAVFFDETQLPKIIAYNSGFNVGIYPTPGYLGIGLEWYSGSELDIMNRLPPTLFPQYQRDKMKPKYLVPNALKGWLKVKYKDLAAGGDLLNRMIFSGKILFLTDILLENVSSADLLNYSQKQIAWTRDQEYEIWNYFLENDLLFSKDAREINKMMGDGPFTPGMPRESPGGVGNWIGYKMVKTFMENHPEITLPELMKIENNKRFLKDYKP